MTERGLFVVILNEVAEVKDRRGAIFAFIDILTRGRSQIA